MRQPIENAIQRQLAVNRSKNLLYARLEQSMELESGFLNALQVEASQSEIPPDEAVTFAVQSFLDRLHSVNPYLQISGAKIAELERIYHQTFRYIKQSGEICSTLKAYHYPSLARWLGPLYPPEFRQSLRASPVVSEVVYGEYSAELQVELLGLDVAHLKPPVLDIGCGRQAHLAKHLHTLGLDVYGIDSRLETRAPYLKQADWFDYVFETEKWGTVISNMAFTNHLNYAYRHDSTQLQAYLLKAREIFASLTPGGSFYCAPGLPFIEDRLPRKHYRIVRRQPTSGIFVSVVTKLQP